MNTINTRALLMAVACASWTYAAEPRPNVLLIISDDQGWADFGFMGHEAIKTPHLDRLASQGVLFPNAYVTAPLCRPSLAPIMSGQYGFQTRICCNDPPDGVSRIETHSLIRRVPTLPRLLTKAGYRTLQTGKFWEGSYDNAGFTHGITEESDRHASRKMQIGRDGLQPIYDFLEAGGDAPWFVWYAPMMPHEPHNPPQRILKKYKTAGRNVKLARYWAMCEWFDETCGELLNHLEQKKLLDNTLVVFIVDNGWIQETGPARRIVGGCAPKSKLSPYDGGLRTPVILRWPKHVAPQRREELVSSIDLAPTILKACGVEAAPEMTGADLLQVASGKLDLKSRPVFSESYLHTEVALNDPGRNIVHRVVRQGDWKLILPVASTQPAELYHIPKDPTEEKNLAAENPQRVKELTGLLDAWWKPQAQSSSK